MSLTLCWCCRFSPLRDAAICDRQYDEACGIWSGRRQLDNLRPTYDAAQTAANAVCKEIAGTTPEESATVALQGLGDVLNTAAAPPADEGKKGEGKKGDELDKTIDNLIAAQKDVQEKQAALRRRWPKRTR